jgi:hypothetical protein
LFGSFSGTMPMSDFSNAYMPGLYAFRFPRPILNLQGYTWDLPVPAHETYAHASGLWLRGAKQALTLSYLFILPSPPFDKVGTPIEVISELNTGPMHPLLTRPHAIAGRRGIAQGRSGSLLLTP